MKFDKQVDIIDSFNKHVMLGLRNFDLFNKHVELVLTHIIKYSFNKHLSSNTMVNIFSNIIQ